MKTIEMIGIASAHNGIDDGHPDVIGVPPGEGLVISYIGLAIIVAGLFFFFRKNKK